VPLVLYQPFALREFMHCGATLSVFGITRLGSTLSILHDVILSSALAIRGHVRIGSALALLDFSCLGSSLSLRSFVRLGSSLSVFGSSRIGSTLSVFDSFHLSPEKVVKMQGWTLSCDSATNHIKFTPDRFTKYPLVVTPTGGILHGTWSAESVVSASDRRLKRRMMPLERHLDTTVGGPQGSPGEPHRRNNNRERDEVSRPAPTASDLLAALRPKRFLFGNYDDFVVGPQSDSLSNKVVTARFGFVAEEVEEVLPDVVRRQDGTTQLVYQDLIALLALAAKERLRRLSLGEARQEAECAMLRWQDAAIEALERQADSLRGRFLRLQRRGYPPHPPP